MDHLERDIEQPFGTETGMPFEISCRTAFRSLSGPDNVKHDGDWDPERIEHLVFHHFGETILEIRNAIVEHVSDVFDDSLVQADIVRIGLPSECKKVTKNRIEDNAKKGLSFYYKSSDAYGKHHPPEYTMYIQANVTRHPNYEKRQEGSTEIYEVFEIHLPGITRRGKFTSSIMIYRYARSENTPVGDQWDGLVDQFADIGIEIGRTDAAKIMENFDIKRKESKP